MTEAERSGRERMRHSWRGLSFVATVWRDRHSEERWHVFVEDDVLEYVRIIVLETLPDTCTLY